jgi:hypothetical protein
VEEPVSDEPMVTDAEDVHGGEPETKGF